MSSDDNSRSDRDVILRRRLFFVSSALTALTGCPQDPPPATTASPPVASVPQTSPSGALPDGQGSVTVDPPAPQPKLPPLDVPTGVTGIAKENYEQLANEVPLIHAEIDAAEKLAGELCHIDDPQCDPQWAELAAKVEKVKESNHDLSPRCAGSSDVAKQFAERVAAHRKAIEQRLADLDKRIRDALDSAEQRRKWKALQEKNAPPQVCLKYSCDDW